MAPIAARFLAIPDRRSTGASGSAGGAAGSSDWSDAPADLLHLVSTKLPSIFDHLHFRGTCFHWRRAIDPARLPPHPPLLVLPPLRRGSAALSFFNPTDRRVYTRDFEESRGMWVLGSQYGWLVLLGRRDEPGAGRRVSLLNPLTGAHLPLPLLPNNLVCGPVAKAVLRCPPNSHPFVIIWLYRWLVFCRPGDCCWAVLEVGFTNGEITNFDDALYIMEGSTGRVAIVDTGSMTIRSLDKPLGFPVGASGYHLMEAAGELLLVTSYDTKEIPVKQFSIYKLSRSETPGWVRVSDELDGITLFLSDKQSVAASNWNLPDCSNHHLYFATDNQLADADSLIGLAMAATVCTSTIVAGRSAGRNPPYYFQAPRRECDSRGLTWMIPTLH